MILDIKELIERKWLSDKKNEKEMQNSKPASKTPSSQDAHKQTQEERELSKDWVEKIHSRHGETLTCGNRVFYVDPQGKGSKRWRTGIILQRKQDYIYSSGVRRSYGYDIYDIENCTTVSRTRQDIWKYKHTKIEREILEKANKHLVDMRREFMKNGHFRSQYTQPPVEFEIRDYDDVVKNSPHKPTEDPKPTEATTLQSTPEAPAEQTADNTPIKTEPQDQVEQPKNTKCRRELKNLETGLNGPSWECTENHGRCLRVKTTGIEDKTEYQDSWNNTVPIQETENPEDLLDKKD